MDDDRPDDEEEEEEEDTYTYTSKNYCKYMNANAKRKWNGAY